MSKNKITDQQLVALEKILDYMWKDEMKHWFEYDMPEEHTFSCLKELGKLVPNFSGHEYLIECLDKIKQEAVD